MTQTPRARGGGGGELAGLTEADLVVSTVLPRQLGPHGSDLRVWAVREGGESLHAAFERGSFCGRAPLQMGRCGCIGPHLVKQDRPHLVRVRHFLGGMAHEAKATDAHGWECFYDEEQQLRRETQQRRWLVVVLWRLHAFSVRLGGGLRSRLRSAYRERAAVARARAAGRATSGLLLYDCHQQIFVLPSVWSLCTTSR